MVETQKKDAKSGYDLAPARFELHDMPKMHWLVATWLPGYPKKEI